MAKGRKDEIAEQVAQLRAEGIEFLRFELPDLHAISRSKLVPIDAVGHATSAMSARRISSGAVGCRPTLD